ncbi:microneme protein 2, putative [Eimeria brunetti]|uniref:Microneme protein 2, putative n=1 Tax=Eimeria brunetti TaxID=51314 RepID=U6M033_9EIME|nr:microneme protein 2, putative [Eimeria brunetti]
MGSAASRDESVPIYEDLSLWGGPLKGVFGCAAEHVRLLSCTIPTAERVCTNLLDVVAVIDESGSIGTANFDKVRKFLSQFGSSLPLSSEDVRVGLVSFGTRAVKHWDLKDPRAQSVEMFVQATKKLPYGSGSTYTHLGLNEAEAMLFSADRGGRENVPKLILLMTDGASSKRTLTFGAAKRIRDRGVIIVVLGVGSGVNSMECRNIAGCSTTDCPRYLQSDWNGVSNQVKGIILAACLDLAQDAICSEWSDFGPCQGECGKEGERISTRVEVAPQRPGTPPCPTCPAPQGRSCAEQFPGLTRREPCTMPACRVDAHCGEFGPWSEWSTTCGSATRQRERQGYDDPPASGGGLSCSEQNPPKFPKEVETVQKPPCPVQQQPGPWGDWSECSATCGGGTRYREREGYPQVGELYGGETLEAQGIAVRESETCNENPCPVNATCGEWTAFTECSRPCGGGTQERRRDPWNNDAKNGGLSCMEQFPGGPTESVDCNTQPCPVDEVPGEWAGWGPCSKQCGGGTQVRHRGPSQPEANFGGKSIEEQNLSLPDGEKILRTEERTCNDVPCGPCTLPFTEWTACQSCSGTRTRESMVAFDYDDAPCSSVTHEEDTCEAHCGESSTGGGGMGGGAGGVGGGGAGGVDGEGAGGAEGGGSSGAGSEEEPKEEGGGFPTAAVAGGVAGGILAVAAGAGAFYGMSGGAASAAGGAGAEVMADAGTTNPPDVEREALISAGEQSEMWAS